MMSATLSPNLPLARKSPHVGVQLPLDEKRPEVLVVDDDDRVRLMLRLGLERHGFRVWLSGDGEEAIDLYRQHTAEISDVLLDVQMLGMDGPETLTALRRIAPDVVACFMSGDTEKYDVEGLRRRGARHVFAKPFLLDELAQNLHAIGGTSSWMR